LPGSFEREIESLGAEYGRLGVGHRQDHGDAARQGSLGGGIPILLVGLSRFTHVNVGVDQARESEHIADSFPHPGPLPLGEGECEDKKKRAEGGSLNKSGKKTPVEQRQVVDPERSGRSFRRDSTHGGFFVKGNRFTRFCAVPLPKDDIYD
jgi:hypothetical protein